MDKKKITVKSDSGTGTLYLPTKKGPRKAVTIEAGQEYTYKY
jgi:hypothetical protein